MTTRQSQEVFTGDQPSTHKPEDVFNSDDNDGTKEDNGYDSHSYEQYIRAIKSENFALFQDILNAHPEYTLRLEPYANQTAIFEIVQISSQELAIEMLKLQKSKDADLAFRDKLRQNVLFYVARDGKVRLFDYLVSQGVSAQEVDSHGQTPLFYAAREGHTEMCRRLIGVGADVNHSDFVKQTCLFYSAKDGHLETCKFLIESGAKHNHVDKKKQTALFFAKRSGNAALVEFFESLKNQKPVAPPKEKSVSESKSNNKKKKGKEESKSTFNLVYTNEHGQKVQMTNADFQRFISEHPHLAEYFQNPEKLQVEGVERETWDKIAKKIVQVMWKLRGAYHFHTPVDPVRLNCPDYPVVIKNPMDLGTIKNRLAGNFYPNVHTFIADMKLMFNNCITYNGAESEIGQISLGLEREFDRLSREYGLENQEEEDQSEMVAESQRHHGTPSHTEHDHGNEMEIEEHYGGHENHESHENQQTHQPEAMQIEEEQQQPSSQAIAEENKTEEKQDNAMVEEPSQEAVHAPETSQEQQEQQQQQQQQQQPEEPTQIQEENENKVQEENAIVEEKQAPVEQPAANEPESVVEESNKIVEEQPVENVEKAAEVQEPVASAENVNVEEKPTEQITEEKAQEMAEEPEQAQVVEEKIEPETQENPVESTEIKDEPVGEGEVKTGEQTGEGEVKEEAAPIVTEEEVTKVEDAENAGEGENKEQQQEPAATTEPTNTEQTEQTNAEQTITEEAKPE